MKNSFITISFLFMTMLALNACAPSASEKDIILHADSASDVETQAPVPIPAMPDVLLPFDAIGTYTAQGNDADVENECEMTLMVFKKDNTYSYQLKTSKRMVSGKASFTKGEGQNEYYINLEGLPWEEYKGDISNQADNKIAENIEIPISVDGEITEGEILIQNLGNAMNYYVKIGECGSKFIHLVRQ